MSLAGFSRAEQADFDHAMEFAAIHELARERRDHIYRHEPRVLEI
jgi:hypothetical protein